MAGRIREYYRTPSGTISRTDPRFTIAYKITHTIDPDEVISLLMAEAPTSWSLTGHVLANVTYEFDVEDHMVWNGIVNYSKKSREKTPLEEGQSSYNFETSGGTVHMNRSLETISKYPAPGVTAPEFYGLIGWNDGQADGVDVVSPVFNFSETHVLPASTVNNGYKLALYRATGKVNAGAFKGLAAGEVLFLGASGTSRGDDAWEINYRFAASENITGLTIGDITGVAKKGWEYLWVYFEDDVSESTLIKKPRVAIVDRVHETWNFAAIGIGT